MQSLYRHTTYLIKDRRMASIYTFRAFNR